MGSSHHDALVVRAVDAEQRPAGRLARAKSSIFSNRQAGKMLMGGRTSESSPLARKAML
jgi:hypothetical protein